MTYKVWYAITQTTKQPANLEKPERLSDKSIHNLKFWLFVESSEDWVYNLEATLLFVDFSKAFNAKHRENMEQILQVYRLPIWTTIIMLYKNTKTIAHSPDGDTNFFDIVVGVLQRDTLLPY